MANLSRKTSRHAFLAAMVASLALWPFVQCQTNPPLVNQTAHFSHFDLFQKHGVVPVPGQYHSGWKIHCATTRKRWRRRRWGTGHKSLRGHCMDSK
jgi:hypothetical protein